MANFSKMQAGNRRYVLDNRLLLNRETVLALSEASLGDFWAQSLDLSGARRLGQWHSSNSTNLYLLSLFSAAVRKTAHHYLNAHRVEVGLDSVRAAGQTYFTPGLDKLWPNFSYHYPVPDFSKSISAKSRGTSISRQQAIVELLLLSVLIDNPATTPFRSLFDDTGLLNSFNYRPLLDLLSDCLVRREAPGFSGAALPELLRRPIQASPESLSGQLEYILSNWATWLPRELLIELRVGQAILREESQLRGPGPGPTELPNLRREVETDLPAAFSSDTDWMASTVLLAKSIYVWLGQLSQRYHREIRNLSQIPEEELANLANWGFNALWLIGIWERSQASRLIKQHAGNSEAEASAYALHAYRIAPDLGGEDALAKLQEQCDRFGIRLGCDVVPNHTGIDSEWVLAHPDWFLQSDQPPFPTYRFSGPNLSSDPSCSIRIEDGYWNHSDAAVVFEHYHHQSGRRRYIFHGNDGTHMPWNDTAQLNFLLPEVREAMKNLIVATAKRFRVIRFDAAMTLARKHFRRLWFPPPGGSAGVPSRSAFWMSDAEFAKAFPVEFWREVVDRIHAEAPDTLLIAEAFWLMESYFVRTLGMHRVYNSAFMNLLKQEENAKYRRIIKDTLAFNPEILKRYVNFMNNPDEATAVSQFGKGDKYFGVAVLLATLPGLPMFGHGQIEGFEEKYGMEYRRAYWAEEPDLGFIRHHETQIFPLLRRRHLFAGVEHFHFYDFETEQSINENVYAYSNGPPESRFLIVYNNAPHATQGRLHFAADRAHPDHEGNPLTELPLAGQLGLPHGKQWFCRFRNLRNRQEQLWPCDELQKGLRLQLHGYEYQVLYDFEVLCDTDGYWSRLYGEIHGSPTADLDNAFLRLKYQPLWNTFQNILSPRRMDTLCATVSCPGQITAPLISTFQEFVEELENFVQILETFPEVGSKVQKASGFDFESDLKRLHSLLIELPEAGAPGQFLFALWHAVGSDSGLARTILNWYVLQFIGRKIGVARGSDVWALIKSLGLDQAWLEINGLPGGALGIHFTEILLRYAGQQPHPAISSEAFSLVVRDPHVRSFLGVNRHAGETWFNRERMMLLCGAFAISGLWPALPNISEDICPHSFQGSCLEIFRQRQARAAAVGYQLDKFLGLE